MGTYGSRVALPAAPERFLYLLNRLGGGPLVTQFRRLTNLLDFGNVQDHSGVNRVGISAAESGSVPIKDDFPLATVSVLALGDAHERFTGKNGYCLPHRELGWSPSSKQPAKDTQFGTPLNDRIAFSWESTYFRAVWESIGYQPGGLTSSA